jgi:hypothetical protein
MSLVCPTYLIKFTVKATTKRIKCWGIIWIRARQHPLTTSVPKCRICARFIVVVVIKGKVKVLPIGLVAHFVLFRIERCGFIEVTVETYEISQAVKRQHDYTMPESWNI